MHRDLADTVPTRAQFMGLHVKAVAVDSPGLTAELAALIRRELQPATSWRVELDADGKLRWVSSDAQVTRQPARSAWQRVTDLIFMAVPAELY